MKRSTYNTNSIEEKTIYSYFKAIKEKEIDGLVDMFEDNAVIYEPFSKETQLYDKHDFRSFSQIVCMATEDLRHDLFFEDGACDYGCDISTSVLSTFQKGGKSGQVIMKRAYQCPVCLRISSRKWNLRKHCVRMHGYDPSSYPVIYGKASVGHGYQSKKNMLSSNNSRKRVGKPITLLKEKLRQGLFIEGLRTGCPQNLNTDTMYNETASTLFFDSFEVISKKSIEGISGYLCARCMTFDCSFVKNIGIDLTLGETHKCTPKLSIRLRG